VTSGGTTIATIFAGGALILLSGAVEIGDVISTGIEIVSAGAIASDTIVFGQGKQIVSGGKAFATTVSSGGTQVIAQSGTAGDTFVSALGVAIVRSGGIETNATIFTGGTELVSQGGLAQGTTISAGGFSSIGSGGTAIGTTLLSGAEQHARGASFDALVFGGTLSAESGSLATSAIVSRRVSAVMNPSFSAPSSPMGDQPASRRAHPMASWVGRLEQRAISPTACIFVVPDATGGSDVATRSGKFELDTALAPVWTV